MVPVSMTLCDLWPGFQGHDIFEVEHRKNGAYKNKVTIAHYYRKLYVTYRMVLCLVTLTDL